VQNVPKVKGNRQMNNQTAKYLFLKHKCWEVLERYMPIPFFKLVDSRSVETCFERKLENNLSEIEKREIRTKLEIKKQSLEQWSSTKPKVRLSGPEHVGTMKGRKIQSISLSWRKGIVKQ